MSKKKSNLKILISSSRLVNKITKSIYFSGNYPSFIDYQYPDIRVAFYSYKICKRIGCLVYRHNIIGWNTRVSDE